MYYQIKFVSKPAELNTLYQKYLKTKLNKFKYEYQ